MNNQIPDQQWIAERDKAAKTIQEMTEHWESQDANWPEANRQMLNVAGPMIFDQYLPKLWPLAIKNLYRSLSAVLN